MRTMAAEHLGTPRNRAIGPLVENARVRRPVRDALPPRCRYGEQPSSRCSRPSASLARNGHAAGILAASDRAAFVSCREENGKESDVRVTSLGSLAELCPPQSIAHPPSDDTTGGAKTRGADLAGYGTTVRLRAGQLLADPDPDVLSSAGSISR